VVKTTTENLLCFYCYADDHAPKGKTNFDCWQRGFPRFRRTADVTSELGRAAGRMPIQIAVSWMEKLRRSNGSLQRAVYGDVVQVWRIPENYPRVAECLRYAPLPLLGAKTGVLIL